MTSIEIELLAIRKILVALTPLLAADQHDEVTRAAVKAVIEIDLMADKARNDVRPPR